ncbi:asparaginase domain-containing protein [Nitratiruptor sp. YY09-18]|uniref:asparaginase domain-containing protein n=1 Tax=Nitratiruptor sp. YY09-18 TaxID=2724901 RepID=UPI001915AA53|nr:asparaginase domain-containing protein [Nitratiruptor sp. YY09-18]BCD67611.1 L-asparaginase [Nitratiruptor sp. YY09-18]
MIILNTGGTFNKIYDKIKGELIVPPSNQAIEEILQKCALKIPIKGLIYKDSLEFTQNDREELAQTVKELPQKSVIVVHGTDTMDKSAAFIAKQDIDKCIVLTGAMVPYAIDQSEASANLMLAIAKAKLAWESGVFIAMHGNVAEFDTIYKDRQRGVFCLK